MFRQLVHVSFSVPQEWFRELAGKIICLASNFASFATEVWVRLLVLGEEDERSFRLGNAWARVLPRLVTFTTFANTGSFVGSFAILKTNGACVLVSVGGEAGDSLTENLGWIVSFDFGLNRRRIGVTIARKMLAKPLLEVSFDVSERDDVVVYSGIGYVGY